MWSASHKALRGKRYKVKITKREYFRIESENQFIPTECKKNIYYFYTKNIWIFSIHDTSVSISKTYLSIFIQSYSVIFVNHIYTVNLKIFQ